MPDEDFNERERALQYAARLKGLSLLRTGTTYALAQYKLSDATLDEIEVYLRADDQSGPDDRGGEDDRRADLRALLKAERAMMAELAEEKRRASAKGASPNATAAALAEIRRRIAELQEEKKTGMSRGSAE